jgi:MATE family multidrug resistance protein
MSALPSGDVRPRHVLGLAWPVLVSMCSMTLMNLADTLFAGWLGTSELAAVGLASTVGFFALTPARGLLRGVKILTSHAAGAEDAGGVRALLVQAAWMALFLAIGLAPLALLGPSAFAWMGASERVAPLAASYFGVFVGSAAVFCGVWAVEGWFQGRGDPRTPMLATVVGNGVNLVLDPWLMFGGAGVPALGVSGAALATVIATGVQLGVLVVFAVPHARGLALTALAPRWRGLWDAARFGGPLAAQWTLDFAGFLVLLALLARAGDAELAAHVLVFRIVMVSILPGFAIGDAAGVLVGQAMGARRPEAARQAWWVATWMAAVLMGGFALAFVAVPGAVLLPFGPEPEVARVAVTLLALAAVWQVADALLLVNFSTLAAGGDTRFTLVLFVGGSWLVQVPLSLLLVAGLGWGAVGAWVALSFEIVAVALISTARVRARGWLEGRPPAPAAAAVALAP